RIIGKTIKECHGDFCGTETLFYDTKGLADPEEDDEKLLKTLYDVIATCNIQYIVFICLPLISEVDRSVYNLAKLLISKFGENYSIWLNSVIVLTQANLFSPQNGEEESDDDDDDDRKLEIKK
uniref:AIG1-type G domain-containing protein n=1 Tax=Amphimedon queenslandica TaxID=400682 RepID=A0A1X7UCN4_AMPQE